MFDLKIPFNYYLGGAGKIQLTRYFRLDRFFYYRGDEFNIEEVLDMANGIKEVECNTI
jgi:hypothetical protein